MAGRVVDVHEHRIEAPIGPLGIETRVVVQREEVAGDQSTARIGAEFSHRGGPARGEATRARAPALPPRSTPAPGGRPAPPARCSPAPVHRPQPRARTPPHLGQRKPSEFGLGDGEKARHQEVVVQLHLEHGDPADRVLAPPEAQLTDRVRLQRARRIGCSSTGHRPLPSRQTTSTRWAALLLNPPRLQEGSAGWTSPSLVRPAR